MPVALTAQTNIWSLQNLGNDATIHYEISHTKDGATQSGQFEITTANSGGQLMATVNASLGENTCSSTTPLQNTQAVQMQLIMSCMAFAPVAMTMFAPTWAMFAMTTWELGSQMDMSQSGRQFSFEITEECTHAGVTGLLAKLRTDDTEWDTCAKQDMPIPLSVRMANSNEVIQATLTRYNVGN
jgi:ABC-type proline/glycine betaine transport system substrate-binding protein